MRLVIAEKPSVAAALVAALGVKNKKDGYMEGGGYLISCLLYTSLHRSLYGAALL